MEVSSGPSSQLQVDVLKKSTEVQERAVSQLLDNSSAQLQEQQKIAQETQKTSGAALTGLGTGLDISA